jgi:SAM-dependent methyltransferase
MSIPKPSAAFDALATDYDITFTHTHIGSLMRQAVWQRLDACFQPGQSILELNCGTGADAVYLGQRGVHVLATDVSQEMVALTRQKVMQAGLENMITVQQRTIEQLDEIGPALFDGVVSNFGGLNCVANLPDTGRALAERLKPGAQAVLCMMGPLVPWEWAWFVGHGAWGSAFRRLRRHSAVWQGMTVYYPSIRTARRAFAPWFRQQRVSALGVFLPPPYTEQRLARYPHLAQWLARLNSWERRLETVPPLPWLADHYVLELQRV